MVEMTPSGCASYRVSGASYFAALPQNASYGEAVLHKMPDDEAAPFHYAMKHCSVSLHNMKHATVVAYDKKVKHESFAAFRRNGVGFFPVRGKKHLAVY